MCLSMGHRGFVFYMGMLGAGRHSLGTLKKQVSHLYCGTGVPPVKEPNMGETPMPRITTLVSSTSFEKRTHFREAKGNERSM